ncbi:uncharacterized protein LTR77_008956 [Saxophila tyrrhenica]|uniref:Alcohol dehydrogenase n=1 Tax=Saxophila tyrrhenica TaxID=1690608 RepID=A0AAV9P328_9PEZI|nr:hypothetical protein LTR77_008956 [Saxophila tyrrhenica]
MKVFVADADVPGLRALSKQLNTNPQDPAIYTTEVDVAEWESIERAFRYAVSAMGRIDYVFPIAGIGERRSFPNKPKSDEYVKPDMSVIDIDQIGVIYTVSLAVQHFRRLEKNRHGVKGRSACSSFREKCLNADRLTTVVAVASVCGFYIHTTIPLYTAAKHAIVGFTRSYGKILAEESITFNSVCPNKIRTSIGTAESYEKAEKAGCLVPMEKLLECFEMLLSGGEHKDLSGECLEVAPQLGIRIAPKVEFVNEESKKSAEITYERSHYLHEVVE